MTVGNLFISSFKSITMKKIIEGNGVKNFLIKLSFFVITIATADIVIGLLLKKTYFKQKAGYDYLTTVSIKYAKAPVMIFGSSRAVNIFNPAVMEKVLNVPCFNAGRVGQSVFYHYAVLKSVLKRYTPETVILSFDAGNFTKDQEDYDRISSLLPYYHGNPEIGQIVSLKGPYEKIKTISSIYPFNSLLLPILSGNLEKSKHRYEHVKGFIPIKKTAKGPLHTMDFTKTATLDINKIDIYKAFIKECINSNIDLHVVCPPYLINAIGNDASLKVAKEIAAEYKIDFIDYSRDDFYTRQPDLFADFRHLNAKGADIFTEKVALQLTGSKLSNANQQYSRN